MLTPVLPVSTDARALRGPKQGTWTIADWEALPQPDDTRYEIIEGVLYMSTSPSLFHQHIIWKLARLIGVPAEDQGRAYVFLAPVGLLLPTGDALQPDLALVKSERSAILFDRRIRGVPDLIVEVLSPGSRDYDEGVKLDAYSRAGVPEYAVIDPAARQLRLYALAASGGCALPRLYHEADTLAFACLPDISFAVGDLFAGAPDTTP